jgi:hypothetical protein
MFEAHELRNTTTTIITTNSLGIQVAKTKQNKTI